MYIPGNNEIDTSIDVSKIANSISTLGDNGTTSWKKLGEVIFFCLWIVEIAGVHKIW